MTTPTREQVIEWAREAGFNSPDDRSDLWLNKVERFAALVAAHENEAIEQRLTALRSMQGTMGRQFAVDECLAAIRARKE
jgi:hypothetical protein